MKNWTVYFEAFGRNLKITVTAESEEKAKDLVLQKIRFHKVEKTKDEFNDVIDIIDQMSEFFNPKKPKQ